MSSKMNWDRVAQQRRARSQDKKWRLTHDHVVREQKRQKNLNKRQKALREFVESHGLSCFKCHSNSMHTQWAKTGFNKRGAWAICAACVTEGKKQA